MRRVTLLTIDASINLLLGVLFGIGIALMLERRNRRGTGLGLGLGGAIAINLCGGLVLCGWLVFGDLSLPLRGLIFLWFLVVLLVGLSVIELVTGFQGNRSDV